MIVQWGKYLLFLRGLGLPVRSVYICSDDVESEIVSVDNLNLKYPRNWNYILLPHTVLGSKGKNSSNLLIFGKSFVYFITSFYANFIITISY